MPFRHFVVLMTLVLVAAAGTVWVLSIAAPALLAAAIPVALLARLAIRNWRI